MTIRLSLLIPTMDRGGAEKQLVLLAEHLPRPEFDVSVILLTRDGPRGDRLRQLGVPVISIGKRFKLDPTALLRLREAFRRTRPDVVHTWLFAANSFGRVAARWAGVPHIVASERCVDRWKTWTHFQIDRRLSRFTEAITTNSSGVRDFYVRHGIDPAKFRVIPNGIEASDRETISRQEALGRLGLEPDQRLILAVGRLWPQKRYRDLIWAAELIATVQPGTTLVIIGDGPQRGELLRHRDAVTTPHRVRFAGGRDDVAALLPHADAFWIASEYEGQSNAVMEAMRAGVPVVGSDIPGNRDLIVPDETGFLVEVGDKAGFARQTNRLFESPELAETLGRAARERIASGFTAERMASEHAALYRELVVRER